jgi:hypothetical protein
VGDCARVGFFAGAGPIVFWASDPIGPGETVLAIGDGFGERPMVEVVRLPDDAVDEPSAQAFAWPGEAVKAEVFQPCNRSVRFLAPATFKPGVFGYRITLGLWIKPDAVSGRHGLVSKRWAGTAAPFVLSVWDGRLESEATDEKGQWSFNFRSPPVVKAG